MNILQPCDILLYIDEGKSPISKLSQWAIGRFNHVSMYLGEAFDGVGFVYESNGRGVSIVSLQHQVGRLVLVLRPLITEDDKVKVINTAIEIASNPKSYYDYFCIVQSCVPRVLKERFTFLPIPLQYHRDASMICSEAVAEVFWQNMLKILPRNVVPLPSDFATSRVLRPLYVMRIGATSKRLILVLEDAEEFLTQALTLWQRLGEKTEFGV